MTNWTVDKRRDLVLVLVEGYGWWRGWGAAFSKKSKKFYLLGKKGILKISQKFSNRKDLKTETFLRVST